MLDLCRFCLSKPETTAHILSGSDSLAKEYLERHNGIAQYIHHALSQNFNIQTCTKWHTQKPPEVLMLKNVEILYHSILNTDRPHIFDRPDIFVRDKESKMCYIIDVSCPNDINVNEKEQGKISEYSCRRVELGRVWN